MTGLVNSLRSLTEGKPSGALAHVLRTMVGIHGNAVEPITARGENGGEGLIQPRPV